MNTRITTLGAAAFALVAVTVSTTAVYDSYAPSNPVLIPPMLSDGRLTGQVSNIPINEFTPQQAAAGIVLPKDSHNFFSCEYTKVKPRHNDLGKARTWVYEFTGKEQESGFKGSFFISGGELSVNPQYRNLDTLRYFYSGRRYYQMGAVDLQFSCSEGLSLVNSCGDHICQADENATSCAQDCNVCGDGVIFGNEECDDNNGLDHDGCDVYCTVELGHTCEGTPSSCTLLIPTLPGGGGGSSSNGMSSFGMSSSPQGGCYNPDGDDIYTKGTATFNGQSETDFCSGDDTLVEYGCGFGFLEGLQIHCVHGCSNGACQRANTDGGGFGGDIGPGPGPGNVDASILGITIDGPVTSDHAATEKNVNLGNITLDTGDANIDVDSIFIAVHGLTSDNKDFGGFYDMRDILENVRLQKLGSQETYVGTRLTSSVDSGQSFGSEPGTFQIYRFDGIKVRGDEQWQLLVDFIDNGSNGHPREGDKFRIQICGEPTHVAYGNEDNIIINTKGCNFGGLINESTAYQMFASKPSSGLVMANVTPRGTIASNFQNIGGAATPRGYISMKEIGTSNVATENQKNITLLRFEARAEGKGLLLTEARFEKTSGYIGDIQNYTLWVDTDNNGDVDTILESGVVGQYEQAHFNDLVGGGYALPVNQNVVFEVHGDVASSLVDDSFQLSFADGTSTPFAMEVLSDGANLHGVETNGNCPAWQGPCDQFLTTVDSTVWSFASQGSLFVTQDSTPLRSRQLLNGTLGEAILRLELHAEDEDADVTFIKFTPEGSIASSVDRLELYLEGQNTPFALATKGGCGTQGGGGAFCAVMESQQLIVQNGSDLDVIVRPKMKSDNEGGVIGQIIQLSVNGDDAVQARGVNSSNEYSPNNGDNSADGEVFIGTDTVGPNNQITGNKNVSVSSKITSITNANPDANGTSVPVGITPIGQFKITAAAHNNSKNGDNDVAIDGMIFNVNAANVVIDAASFTFYNKADVTKTVSCSAHYLTGEPFSSQNISGSFKVRCSDIDLSTVDGEIDEGTDQTFVLQADITNPQLNPSGASTLRVSLENFNQIDTTFDVNDSHILWLDVDAIDGAEFPWVEYPEAVINSTQYNS